MEDSSMSGQESLALIESMIKKAKNQFSENGHLYLVWGWVVFFCSLVHYFVGLRFGYEKSSMVWMLTWVALAYQMVYIYRRKKTEKVKTYTSEILGAIWIVFAICMVVLILVMNRLLPVSQYFTVLNPMILAVYGLPTFLSGVIIRFTPLKIGGVGCWVLAIAAIFIDPYQHLLLISLAMVIAWIIPGYLLRSRYKKEQYA